MDNSPFQSFLPYLSHQCDNYPLPSQGAKGRRWDIQRMNYQSFKMEAQLQRWYLNIWPLSDQWVHSNKMDWCCKSWLYCTNPAWQLQSMPGKTSESISTGPLNPWKLNATKIFPKNSLEPGSVCKVREVGNFMYLGNPLCWQSNFGMTFARECAIARSQSLMTTLGRKPILHTASYLLRKVIQESII